LPGIKREECETDNCPEYRDRVKGEMGFVSFPPYALEVGTGRSHLCFHQAMLPYSLYDVHIPTHTHTHTHTQAHSHTLTHTYTHTHTHTHSHTHTLTHTHKHTHTHTHTLSCTSFYRSNIYFLNFIDKVKL
jgi:hypothetical protein